jgi:hypothetical protein
MRIRYPQVKRPFKTPFYPLPQILGIAGLIYMMYDIYPDPAMKHQIWMWAGIFLVGSAVYAALWVKLKEKKGLFELSTLDEVLELEKKEIGEEEAELGPANA